ncbi:endo-beta-N-acetylglucosaminidase [Spiroplasma endosymbiont of Nebria brevicollis]|uniref:endo-beta-N-acetylglucosaminidase n=1 Tax=Spiroplasma endosymbiont of Nebria brevicollis TaxID=3066284 RepID=UPI00313C58D2
MKKKIYALLGVSILTAPALTISCAFDFLGIDLSTLPNYDWSLEEPYGSNYQKVVNEANNVTNMGNINIKHNQRYLDYHNFNTGFKNDTGIKKQAVTGIPLNSAFLPNGNERKDFGETDKNKMFEPINSILDWSPATDHDAKYNQSDVPLLATKKVAAKWVNSQNENLKTLDLGLSVKTTSGANTIVGTKRTFDYNFNNWQYVDTFVAWAGAINEGIIVPPAADDINQAHINGTRILGTIFLDGFHGLSKSDLKDYVKTDNNGNYLIVDVLINMAKYMGFDGWIYNNEPNGGSPNGLVMDSQNSINIVRQFTNKTKNSSDESIKNLQMITYKNDGNLKYLSNGKLLDSEADNLSKAATGRFLQDFYTYPNDSAQWNANHRQYNKFDTYNLYNLGGWVGGQIFYNKTRMGTRNINELTQEHFDSAGNRYHDPIQEQNDYQNNKWTFSGQDINSISMFASTTPVDLARMYLENLGHPITIADDTYATVYANYLDDMVYTGHNRHLSNDDKGTTSWLPKTDVSSLSYGIGDKELENTVLFDNVVHALQQFKTNFSTGNGQIFVNDDGKQINNYPWNNRRLADTTPTYKWDIKDSTTNDNDKNIFGFYDYYHAYRKGNALALGGGFDQNGKILPVKFNSEKQWNIMGTNYSNNKKIINWKYKVSGNHNSDFDVNLGVTFDDGSYHSLAPVNSDDGNCWVSMTVNLDSLTIPTNTKIAKLGLDIKPHNRITTTPVTFDVGELRINCPDSVSNSKDDIIPPIKKLASEYAITRDNLTSVRLNWDVNPINKENIDYYEIYLQQDGNYYRLGETTSCNYYVKNLTLNSGSKIIIKSVNKYSSDGYQSWDIV